MRLLSEVWSSSVAAIALGLVSFASASSANLLVNGDFELGAVGFSTDYALDIELLDNGVYAVASAVPDGWANGFEDHGLLGPRLMALFDASTDANDRAWVQSVMLEAGRVYRFDGWVPALTESIRPETAPILELRVGGVVIGTFPAALLDDAWQKFTFEWTASKTAAQTIDLRELRAVLSGDDKVPHDRRFIYGGVGDRLVPADQVRDFWLHWDRPRIEWYQGAHLTFPAHPAVREMVGEALRVAQIRD